MSPPWGHVFLLFFLSIFEIRSKILARDLTTFRPNFGRSHCISDHISFFENIKIWAQRLSYVGELGWELYVPINDAKKIYDIIIKIGTKYKLCNAGVHAMDTLRMEKGYLHWGHDISPEENQYEAGLSFAISFKKDIEFIGKESLKKIKEQKLKKKFVILSLKISKPGTPLILHDEPIYYDGKIVGRTTSGNYSFNFKKNITFGYINFDTNIGEKNLEIEIAKKKYVANLEPKPLHDSENKIMKF